jgi:hypothetical protein
MILIYIFEENHRLSKTTSNPPRRSIAGAAILAVSSRGSRTTVAVCDLIVRTEQEVKMANLYVFHQGERENGQLWYSVFDGTNWSGDNYLPNIGISQSPSAVAWAGGITVFHQGANENGQLWYTYSPDGTHWGGDTYVPNVGLSGSPSAVVYEGKLYVFHQGEKDSADLWYSVFDGTNWSGDRPVPNVGIAESPRTPGSPSAVLWKGGISVFHQGLGLKVPGNVLPPTGDENLWYTYSPDGTSWGGDTQVLNVKMDTSPSAVVHNGKLSVFHLGLSLGAGLWHSDFDGTKWASDTQVPNLDMSESPSAVAWAGGISVFHQGSDYNGTLWYSYSPDGASWGGDTQVLNVSMSKSPSCVVY